MIRPLTMLIAMSCASAQAKPIDYYAPAQTRRIEMLNFYCAVQMQLAQRAMRRGRWVENRRCW